MIITNVCLLLEALSIVICLHHLYGEKFRLDIATISFLSIDMIFMVAINYFELPSVYTMIIYPFIFIYCGIRFGFDIRKLFVNFLLCIIVVGLIQFIVMICGTFVFKNKVLGEVQLLIIDGMALTIVICILSKCKIDKWSIFLQKNEKIILLSLGICIIILFMCLIKYKEVNLLETYQYLLFFISIALIVLLNIQLSKSKLKAKEVETELRLQKLYTESFYGLIENIRLRQHEFNNHITTIYSLHYTNNSYEELVKAQEEYCQLLLKENHFNKLLAKGNPVIIGFLYGKFLEIEKKGIEITYSINFDEFNINVPIYRIVEVLGNLLDNAIEALDKEKEGKKIYIAIEEESKDFSIVIRNKSTFIDYNEISDFFTKGYSKKGSSRGLGLYNVKKICEEYGMSICCENEEINNENWLCFKINKAI